MPIAGYWQKFEQNIKTPKVLVVDDEPVVVNSVRKILMRRGFLVEAAYNFNAALAQVLSQDYDLVFLDMKMPDGNGLDLLQRIKEKRPEQRVIIVTGYASIDSAVEAIRKGASDYMPKPFTPEELYSITSRTLVTSAA